MYLSLFWNLLFPPADTSLSYLERSLILDCMLALLPCLRIEWISWCLARGEATALTPSGAFTNDELHLKGDTMGAVCIERSSGLVLSKRKSFVSHAGEDTWAVGITGA